jgi:ATP-binding cassette subfamily B protein
MILIALICFVLVYPDNSSPNTVGTLGVFVVAAQRMLPLIQQAFAALVQVRSGQESVIDVLNLMERQLKTATKINQDDVPSAHPQQSIDKFVMRNSIELKNVSYQYGIKQRHVINNLSVKIGAGSKVGIVGPTGSGKSTLLDLLVGLLSPTKGVITVDGKDLNSMNIEGWRSQIGYVSQSVFLSDNSIAENIAFGPIENAKQLAKVKLAAEKAQISDFIEQLPDGYMETVGEAGVKLSGGQRQRIAVARALYREASIIVFDEATSALDELTEQNLMKAIYGLGSSSTVIIVTHRHSTLNACDVVFELSDGNLKTRC